MPLATLPSKASAPLSYDLVGEGQPMVVFINGLGLPAASWKASIDIFQSSGKFQSKILTYDRYGQGATKVGDPRDDSPGKEPGYGHDLQDVVQDMRELLQAVAPYAIDSLVLVAASIGVHIARLYAAQNPGTVVGMLLLDSNIGNAELTDAWPSPDTPGAELKKMLADDCSVDVYRESFSKMDRMFNSHAKNPEKLDRRNVRDLLPSPSLPKLQAKNGRGPWVVVVGHDPEAFAEEGLKMLGAPKSLTSTYTQPFWHQYNEGLLKITDTDRSVGVKFAPGCGHFIQKDNPHFVADELEKLLEKVQGAS